jgi:UDP-N-acetylmuramate-alanine ligase
MLDALAAMFNDTIRSCDKLLLLPVYDAGGTADRSVNSDLLADMIDSRKVVEVSGLEDAYEWIYSNRSKFSAVVTCGARDPELPMLARRLAGG